MGFAELSVQHYKTIIRLSFKNNSIGTLSLYLYRLIYIINHYIIIGRFMPLMKLLLLKSLHSCKVVSRPFPDSRYKVTEQKYCKFQYFTVCNGTVI